MFIAAFIILCALAVTLSVAKFFLTDVKWAKIFRIVCIVSGGAGVALAASSVISAITKISSLGALDGGTEKAEWAAGVFSGYLKDVLPVFLIVLAVIILSAYFQPKKLFLRAVVVALSSILILIYGYIATFLSKNENVSVTFEIMAVSCAISLIFTACGYFDFKYLVKKMTDEKGRK